MGNKNHHWQQNPSGIRIYKGKNKRVLEALTQIRIFKRPKHEKQPNTEKDSVDSGVQDRTCGVIGEQSRNSGI